MAIKREDLDSGLVDLSDVTTGAELPLVHPGHILRHDFLEPLGLSAYALANALNIPRSRANDLARCRRAVSADTALRLARFFGTTPEFWINLQARHDLDVAKRTTFARIEMEVAPHAA